MEEDERREFPRVLANWRAALVFQNREVTANLRNISEGGAYVRIREEDVPKVAKTDVGTRVLLRMEQDNQLVSRDGEIRRYVEDSGSTYVAIEFSRRPKASL